MHCVGLDLKFWELVKDEVERALDTDGGRISIDDMHKMIEDRDAQLWVLHDGDIKAVMTTQIINYPQLKAIRIITVTGTARDSWLDCLIETIGKWGAEQGAHIIEFCGRKGWEKVLTNRGFGNTQVFMTRNI